MSKQTIHIDLPALAAMSRDILEWRATSLLPDDAELRRYAKNIRHNGQFGEGELLRKAEDEAGLAAMRFVIRFAEEIEGRLEIAPAEAQGQSPAATAFELRTAIGLMAKTATVRGDIWQRCAAAALRAATMLEQQSLPAEEREAVDGSPSPKTSQQIIDEVNDLAGLMLRQEGYEAPEGHIFYLSDNARARTAFQRASEAYEMITETEVHDALLEVIPDFEEA